MAIQVNGSTNNNGSEEGNMNNNGNGNGKGVSAREVIESGKAGNGPSVKVVMQARGVYAVNLKDVEGVVRLHGVVDAEGAKTYYEGIVAEAALPKLVTAADLRNAGDDESGASVVELTGVYLERHTRNGFAKNYIVNVGDGAVAAHDPVDAPAHSYVVIGAGEEPVGDDSEEEERVIDASAGEAFSEENPGGRLVATGRAVGFHNVEGGVAFTLMCSHPIFDKSADVFVPSGVERKGIGPKFMVVVEFVDYELGGNGSGAPVIDKLTAVSVTAAPREELANVEDGVSFRGVGHASRDGRYYAIDSSKREEDNGKYENSLAFVKINVPGFGDVSVKSLLGDGGIIRTYVANTKEGDAFEARSASGVFVNAKGVLLTGVDGVNLTHYRAAVANRETARAAA